MHSRYFTVYIFFASDLGYCLEEELIIPSFFYRQEGERGWGGIGAFESIEVLMDILSSLLFEELATWCPSSC